MNDKTTDVHPVAQRLNDEDARVTFPGKRGTMIARIMIAGASQCAKKSN